MKYNIAFDITNNYQSKIYHDFCIIGGFFEEGELSPAIHQINNKNNKYITSILNKNGYTGKIGETLLLYHIPDEPSKKILLVGCGKKNKFDRDHYKKITYHAVDTLKKTKITQIISFLTELNVNEKYNNYWKIRDAINIIQELSYTFEQFKYSTKNIPQTLQNVIFYIHETDTLKDSQQAIIDGTIISRNINLAKDLGNMPPNMCNSEYLVQECKKLEKMHDHTTIQIIDENQMQQIGMNAYLAVGQASKNQSLMAIIKYIGDNDYKKKPLVLVGKGVTFDSGGLSIKPSEKMDEMKYDMCGAAAVYAILRTSIQLNLPINIIGILATCENMITNTALRPGDIIKTLSGQTIEIKNTDAEGRLILCEAITYATRFNPKIIIDIATLTGACLIALGEHFTGLMSNNDELANELIIAGKETDDKIWRLPLDNQFQKQINSNIADMTNTGGKGGNTITAGCFLQRFVGKHYWAHLDIAGTAWKSNYTQNHSATGRPITMIIQFLMNYINKQKNKKCYFTQ
ncbi:leucyl aminopeptidase [Blochmannia endosymbiont of Polyrhachis (Hedomyrma) turneri]|uniref:leucyl aminopeptidase n=1 Tax=Blochmannia endosymbiont of Polyrhachis (Hedomyrma) turneri TaxID=1505596 RepID=UPI00061A7FC8|nr:leucyl aminopeptidase [Blochmannia endosymbiont of Polyrhachis (Hedomyrma) turneri]AKC59631.1 cytosol aminopeptidase [Blochmannia endosymbiont of Polyrhachis (Hedomyrma) turneri]